MTFQITSHIKNDNRLDDWQSIVTPAIDDTAADGRYN